MFIGREREEMFLRETIFTAKPEKGFTCSLRGPNGIGKTYLKSHLIEQFQAELDADTNQSIFIIDVLMHNGSYYDFFLSIFKEAAACLTEDVLENPPNQNRSSMIKLRQYLNHIRDIGEINAQSKDRINELLRNFFASTSMLGYYFILIIDEFDEALTLYPRDTDNGELFRTLFALSSKSGKYKLLSIILISRRRAGTIAHHMESGSNFDDAYPAQDTTLRGFNDDEMDQYYQSFENLPCGLLNDESKNEIKFYMGRHPGMLMSFREHVRIFGSSQQSIHVADFYQRYGSGIRNTFSRMQGLLQSEFVDRTNGIPAMSAFKQVFNIVPAYDANLRNQTQLLFDFGFVTEEYSKLVDASDDLSPDSARCLDVVHDAWYAPLSKCFLLYMRDNLPIAEKNEATRLIESTEEKFRRFIQTRLMELHGEAWKEKIDLTRFDKIDFWEHLQMDAEKYGASIRGVEVNPLEVLAFHNLALIVKDYWEDWKQYFASFDSKGKLYKACETLSKHRNCCMHGTLKILGIEQHKELRTICGKLISDFDHAMDTERKEQHFESNSSSANQVTSSNQLPVQLSGGLIHSAGNITQDILSPLELQERNDSYVNTEHDFKCEIKKPRGNLIGTLIDISMPASIARKDAGKITDVDPVGKVYRVRIVQWDNGPMAQKFNVVPIV